MLADLSAVLPGGADLYADVVNDILAVEASPVLMRADESRAQWRPDGPGVTLAANIAYAEPLPADGVAAKHFIDQEPPVPAWDALALASIVRNRHVVQTLRDNLSRSSS